MNGRRLKAWVVRAGTAGLLVAALGMSPATALAAGQAPSVSGDVDGNTLNLTVTAPNSQAALDPTRLTVTVDGAVRPATVAATISASEQRSALLLIDTSGSMAGVRLAAAKDAAHAFLSAVPADVAVGLASFSDRISAISPPTTNRTLINARVDQLQASGETSLYDAIGSSLERVGSTGDRRLIVLSDGADSVSLTTLPTILQELRASAVAVDTVGFQTDATTGNVLSQLSAAGHGRVLRASTSADLHGIFADSARSYPIKLGLHVPLDSAWRGRTVPVRVSVGSGSAIAVGATSVSIPALKPVTTATTQPPSSATHSRPRSVLWVGLAAIFASLVFMAQLALRPAARDRGRLAKALKPYDLTRPAAADDATPESPGILASFKALALRIAQRRGLEERLNLKLDRAGTRLQPAEFLLLQGGLALAGLFVLLLFGAPLVGIGFGVLGWFAPRIWLAVKTSKRRKAFIEQMPDALQLIAGSLSAGYSLPQALDAVVTEGSAPFAPEMGRALAESRIGTPLEDAIDKVADRMQVRDLHWVVMAVRIQREVGGNLAEVLSNVGTTMRERARLRRHVSALSAEGRLSAYILLGLPVLVALFELTTRRSYMRPLYTEPLGIAMSCTAVGLMIAGAAIMKKMIAVRV
jgi:tight adherence protein B